MDYRDKIAEMAAQGLSALEISEALGYEITDIETVLSKNKFVIKSIGNMQKVSKSHKEERAERLDQRIEALTDIALNTLREVMECGDKDSVRLAAAQFVIEQQLGIIKERKESTQLNFNIVNFNERLEQMRNRLISVVDVVPSKDGERLQLAGTED